MKIFSALNNLSSFVPPSRATSSFSIETPYKKGKVYVTADTESNFVYGGYDVLDSDPEVYFSKEDGSAITKKDLEDAVAAVTKKTGVTFSKSDTSVFYKQIG